MSEFNQYLNIDDIGIHSSIHLSTDTKIDTNIDTSMDKLFDNRGFAYADGFFSTMGVYQGHILWLDYHRQRIINHGLALKFTLDVQSVIQQLRSHAQQINEGIVKIVITRTNQTGQGVRGYGFVHGEAEVFIKAIAQSMPYYHNGYPDDDLPTKQIPVNPAKEAICLQSKIGCLPKPLVGLKSLNRLDNVLVAGEFEQARQQNAKLIEGLVADITSDWVEGVMSNVFYQLKGTDIKKMDTWHTPPIYQSGVNGVMRQLIIDKYQHKYQHKEQIITERRLSNHDLANISAMFFCNAVRGIMPISKLWISNNNHLVLQPIYLN